MSPNNPQRPPWATRPDWDDDGWQNAGEKKWYEFTPKQYAIGIPILLLLLGAIAYLGFFGAIIGFLLFAGIIAWMIMNISEDAKDEHGDIQAKKIIKHDAVLYTGVLLVADLVIFLGIKFLWAIITLNGMMYFWMMNGLALLLIALKTKREKEESDGASGDKKKKAAKSKGASKVGNLVIVLMVLLTIGNFISYSSPNAGKLTPRVKVARETAEKVAEVVDSDSPLFAIGKCATGLQHYEAGQEKDKKVRRSGNRVGMFAIPESLEGEASGQKFDIYTPEGNAGYAQWKFNQEGPLQWMEWVDCWSKTRRLRSFTLKVTAPAGGYSTPIIFPEGSKYHVDPQADAPYSFKHIFSDATPWEGKYVPNTPFPKWPSKSPIYSMSWKSERSDSIIITVRVRRK